LLRAQTTAEPHPENRAAIGKREMNPGKNKLWDSGLESRSCSILRFLEPAMNAMLVVTLVTACMVNMACLLCHL